jgi:hypothetical protein
MAGNALRQTHGARTFQRRGVLPPSLARDLAEVQAGFERDLGGVDEMTEGQHGVVRRVVESEALCRLCAAELERLVRERRSIRAAMKPMARAVLTYARLVSMLGLERRAKRVTSLDAFLKTGPDA